MEANTPHTSILVDEIPKFSKAVECRTVQFVCVSKQRWKNRGTLRARFPKAGRWENQKATRSKNPKQRLSSICHGLGYCFATAKRAIRHGVHTTHAFRNTTRLDAAWAPPSRLFLFCSPRVFLALRRREKRFFHVAERKPSPSPTLL